MTKTNILVVDDNADILEFLQDDLSEKFEVFIATGASKAFNILSEQIIHLIISDVMMPEIDGFQLCEKIKNNIEYSHIPIILLTAKNTIQSKIEGLQVGADAYIEKPFLIEYLHAQIDSLLSNRMNIKEYFATQPLVQIVTIANNKADEEFLEKLKQMIENNLDDNFLDVEKLATMMNMSRTSLYRKIKSISDLSANELISLTRLKKAVELMMKKRYNLTEIVQLVGFSSLTHLGRNFQKQFKMTPSEYAKKITTPNKPI
ncbi:MAG TPA: two-component system response regulator [Chryseobacterium sp.]|nr:two-component system response regulator [Chryseobacterium sp.]